MIKDLISIANKLDSKGLTKEADILDQILVKTSQMAEEAAEEAETSTDSAEKIISGLTSAIEGLSEMESSKEIEEDLDFLSKILEKYLV